jgi:hypothetical protein
MLFRMTLPHTLSCTCEECQEMCKRACWPTPEEAWKLLSEGYGDRLMMDLWELPLGTIYILCPAEKGHEKKVLHWPSWSGCVMQQNGLCTLHDKGMKPLEGRLALCSKLRATLTIDEQEEYRKSDGHRHVAMMWDTQIGRDIVKLFRSEIMKEED